uniref:Uncharacterized protein n=1 Tax=Lactuca sativa TaxID=4236 RepID=A0A9R1XJV9_LACSA|nr:hypothetical protein LSAT_V11C400223200 [Lactuca sativa]
MDLRYHHPPSAVAATYRRSSNIPSSINCHTTKHSHCQLSNLPSLAVVSCICFHVQVNKIIFCNRCRLAEHLGDDSSTPILKLNTMIKESGSKLRIRFSILISFWDRKGTGVRLALLYVGFYHSHAFFFKLFQISFSIC